DLFGEFYPDFPHSFFWLNLPNTFGVYDARRCQHLEAATYDKSTSFAMNLCSVGGYIQCPR
ncbi:hypothetical protein, partial [Pseudomonas syringae group genomosp. 7]